MEIKNWLEELMQLIGSIEKLVYGKDEDLFLKMQREYECFNETQRKEIVSILHKEFGAESNLYIFLLSLVAHISNDENITELLVDEIIRSEKSMFKKLDCEVQLIRTNCRYETRRKIREENVRKLKEAFFSDTRYIPLEARDKNSIVIITEQLLSMNHAPTKIVLDFAYYLQKLFGYKVHILVCPLAQQLELLEWSEGFPLNFNESLPKDFNLEYKGVNLNISQILLDESNQELIKEEIENIKKINPLFIYSLGMLNAFADAFKAMTTVVTQAMVTEYPVTEAQVVIKAGNLFNEKQKNQYEYVRSRQEIVLFNVPLKVEATGSKITKAELGLPEDKKYIVIVGNRLDLEINMEYIQFIDSILNIDQSLAVVFAGRFDKWKDFADKSAYSERFYNVGYQEDISAFYENMFLYLNIPRTGGGISALIALRTGVPVVTLPDCDVAYNAGSDFICENEAQELETIERYLSDPEYYDSQKQKGIAHASVSDEKMKKEFSEFIAQIITAINITEK